MSGFDDFFDDDPDSKNLPPREDIPTLANQHARSKADDVLDAVEGIVPRKTIKECPNCPGSILAMRGGLGGNKSLFCRKWRLEIPWANTGSAALAAPMPRPSSGPFYGPPKSKPDKNMPPNRIALERSKK